MGFYKRLFGLLLSVCLLFLCGCSDSDVLFVSPDEAAVPSSMSVQAVEEAEVYDVYQPQVNVTDALLLPVEQNSYPRIYSISHVMIHFMSAVVMHPDDPFSISNIHENFFNGGASVHYVIARDGTVYRMVNERYVAWHAGRGSWAEDERYTDRMNQYAVGIEMLAIGSKDDMRTMLSSEKYDAVDPSWIGYTEAQYEALAALVDDICSRHDIQKDRHHILGHEDYASRKSDPGELFDWTKIGLSSEPPPYAASAS